MLMVQVQLKHDTEIRTCWVENRVKVGNSITLKDSESPDKLWKVLSVSLPKEREAINRGWRVGGL